MKRKPSFFGLLALLGALFFGLAQATTISSPGSGSGGAAPVAPSISACTSVPATINAGESSTVTCAINPESYAGCIFDSGIGNRPTCTVTQAFFSTTTPRCVALNGLGVTASFACDTITISANTVFIPDAGTTSHVHFEGSGLVDTQGSIWAMNGTVPVGVVVDGVYGAGPFSDANWYQTIAVDDALDWVAGSGGTTCIRFTVASLPVGNQVLWEEGSGSPGYYVVLQPGGTINVSNPNMTTANAVVVGAPNIFCVGAGSNNGYAKLNRGTVAAFGGSGYPRDPTAVAMLGKHAFAGFAFTVGRLLEEWTTTTPASATALNNISAASMVTIGAVGDSNTNGYGGMTPYPIVAQGLYAKPHHSIEYAVDGASCEATQTQYTTSVRNQFDVVTVLCGTNNVRGAGGSTDPAVIWATIQAIIDDALANNMKVVVFTIPPCGGEALCDATAQSRMATVNASIMAYSPADPDFYKVDLYTDFNDGTGAMKVAYRQADLLHFSQAGQDRAAALLRAALP